MRQRLFKAAVSTFVLGVGSILFACAGSSGSEAVDQNNSEVTASKNLCAGQVANSFHCIDDTRFELCTGGNQFVVESCAAKGLCATRHPAIQNPCVGAAAATQADGVPPTPPNQIDDTPPAAGGNNGGGNTATGGGKTGGTATGGNNGGGATGGGTATGGGGGKTGGGNNGGQCVGGPKFDPAGTKNVGNGHGQQFIGGQCLSAADCASGCCALPCGICSGPGAQFQAGKQGCGFGG